MFDKEDIKHVVNILKARFQNLSTEEILDLAFKILEGLECYKKK